MIRTSITLVLLAIFGCPTDSGVEGCEKCGDGDALECVPSESAAICDQLPAAESQAAADVVVSLVGTWSGTLSCTNGEHALKLTIGALATEPACTGFETDWQMDNCEGLDWALRSSAPYILQIDDIEELSGDIALWGATSDGLPLGGGWAEGGVLLDWQPSLSQVRVTREGATCLADFGGGFVPSD